MQTNEFSKAFQGEEHQPFHYNGHRKAVLLIHGFPGTPAEMRPLAELLHADGWTAHGILLPGFGPDIETIAERTQAEWLAEAREAYEALRHDHETVLIAGNSMGGALAIQLAATCPTPPEGLLLFAPFWKVNHILWTGLPVLKFIFPQPRVFRLLNLDFNDPEVRAGITNFMPDIDLDDPETQEAIRDFAVPVKMFAQIHATGQTAYRLAPQVNVPAMVFQGQADELVQPMTTLKLVKRLGGDVSYHAVHGEHALIDPASHDWPKIRECVLEFIESV